ncbi:hypothetical protein [Cynomolgus macaque cytomegalovirus strain Mauritius]|uniref:Membrane protein US12 n=2 Tax=Cytomegalovirus TaxID=10358 RepID=A0A0K1GZU0_9BETA|nr:hypothetical protein [Cynomolgus macaque cytomegalovirus strain Mauritius]AXG21927.1 hypothetical protein [synthetic construct]AXG22196.1 hypothetical protein [synthetic construct]
MCLRSSGSMGYQTTARHQDDDDVEEVMRWMRRFVWLVRVYTAMAIQLAITMGLCLLCIMSSWRIQTPYLKDTLPIWMMIVPTVLRFNLRRKTTYRLTVWPAAVVYTALNTWALVIWSMCLERTVMWQAYVFSLVLELSCTVFACVLASTRPRGRLVVACLIVALPLFCAIVYYQSWTPAQKWIAVLTAVIVDLITLALLHDILMVLCYNPRSLFDRHAIRAALLLYVDQVLVLMMAIVPLTADKWYPEYFSSTFPEQPVV